MPKESIKFLVTWALIAEQLSLMEVILYSASNTIVGYSKRFNVMKIRNDGEWVGINLNMLSGVISR